jgi:hypothetical protein
MRTPNPNLVITLDSNKQNRNNANGQDSSSAVVPSPLSSPRSPHTPNQPSPLPYSQSTLGFNSNLNEADAAGYLNNPPLSPALNIPLSSSPKAARSPKSFFSNPLATRSATKLAKQDSPSKGQTPAVGSMAHYYGMSRAMGSSPELTASYNAESEFFFLCF